ncbi:MAG: hypothetical protein WC824_07875 [Bacteroidota bacterium]|jgi:hypothetical protein
MDDLKLAAENLRQLAKSIEHLGHSLEGETLTPDDQVSLGQALNLIIKKSESILTPLKETLRKEALCLSQGEAGSQAFIAPDGSRCSVVINPTTVKVRKDADMAGLKTTLGTIFVELFEELTVYKPRKDFQTAADELQDPNQLQAVMSAVDITSDTPKVYFKDE